MGYLGGYSRTGYPGQEQYADSLNNKCIYTLKEKCGKEVFEGQAPS